MPVLSLTGLHPAEGSIWNVELASCTISTSVIRRPDIVHGSLMVVSSTVANNSEEMDLVS